MGTTRKQDTGPTLILAAIVIGVIVLIIGIGEMSQSNDDPTIAMCDNQAMRPGDTCTTYTNGHVGQTSSYEQVLAAHQASLRDDASTGPVLIVVGCVLVGGAFLSLGGTIAVARRRVAARRR